MSIPSQRAVLALAVSLVVATPALTQTKPMDPRVVKLYEKKRTKVLYEIGQRHVKLGMAARKVGINAQATEQFLLVSEASDGVNIGGDFLLGLQRQYGDAFWRRTLKKQPKRHIRAHYKKAEQIYLQGRKDRFTLAKHAIKYGLHDEAVKLYDSLLRQSSGVLRFDQQGRIPLQGGTIPAEYAARFKKDAITIDGELRLRDEFLRQLPAVKELCEVNTPDLRVRSQMGKKQTQRLHAVLTKLLPKLEKSTGAKPIRQLDVFVFAKDADYKGYLQGLGFSESWSSGLMDPGVFCALVCADKRAPAVVQAIAFHELTHLYDYAISRAVFPSWYTEGFAETYGGVGTFTYAKGKLEIGGKMPAYRIQPLLEEGGMMPLREMLAMTNAQLHATDKDVAIRFYAQAWAFLRYLRLGAGLRAAEKLAVWEARCRGGAVGAQAGKPRLRSQSETAKLFDAAFGAELDRLETGFRAWLTRLGDG